MKLAIISCLVVLAAVCHASKNQDAVNLIKRLLASKSLGHKNGFKNVEVLNSPELLQKMRSYRAAKTASISKSKRHLESHCANAHVELEDTLGEVEEGMILYPKELSYLLEPSTRAHGQSHGSSCSFQLSVDEGQLVVVYVYMGSMNETLPACGLDGAGELALYDGTDAETGVFLGKACGEYEKVFIPHAHELHFTFNEDPTAPIAFFIYYEIVQKEEVMESVDLGEDEVTDVPPVVVDAATEPPVADPSADPTATVRRAFARLSSAKKQKSRYH